MKVRDLLRLLQQDGWHVVRTRGSHRQLKHPWKLGTVTVAGKPGAEVPRGTLRAILKQARVHPQRSLNAIRSSD
jgi:predicted RNA binding protein YcfA (HicA-like mRNA interferase family)